MQPWFMTSPTPPSSTSPPIEANLTTSLFSKATDFSIVATKQYGDEIENFETTLTELTTLVAEATTMVTDLPSEYSSINEEILSNTTFEQDSSSESENSTTDSVLTEDTTETLSYTPWVDSPESNSTTLETTMMPEVETVSTNLNENSTDITNNENLRLVDENASASSDISHQDQLDVTTYETNSPSDNTQSTNHYDEIITEESVNPLSFNNIIKINRLVEDSEDFATSQATTENVNPETTTLETDSIEPTDLQINENVTKPNTELSTPSNVVKNVLVDRSAEVIIAQLTNITNSLMMNSRLEQKNDVHNNPIEQIDAADILIETNSKSESTENIILLNRKISSENDSSIGNENNFRKIESVDQWVKDAQNEEGHIRWVDFNNVTISPDIQEEILKLSRTLSEYSQKGINSPDDTEKPSEFKKEETVIQTIAPLEERVIDKRNGPNITKSNEDDTETSKNTDSTGGTGLDAQTQQDLLSSSSDSGKNSEYKINPLEQIEVDPISTFSNVLTNKNNENTNTSDSVQNFQNATELVVLKDIGGVATKIDNKSYLRIDDSSTEGITSTTEMSVGDRESTTYQNEITNFEESMSTTEFYNTESTITIQTFETTTESNTDSFTQSTTTVESVTSTTEETMVTKPTFTGTMSSDETPNEKHSIGKNSTAESPKSSRDKSSSEESDSKEDNSGENGNFNTQEIPGLLLNDQIPYLELGGFHIITDSKSKNKSNSKFIENENLSDNKQIIKQLIKDNQHLIVIDQASNSKESTEEDRIDRFATELAKILNEEPIYQKELTTNPSLVSKQMFERFREEQTGVKYQHMKDLRNNIRDKNYEDTKGYSTDIMNSVTHIMADEENTNNDIMNTLTTDPTNLVSQSELYESNERGEARLNVDCAECSELIAEINESNTGNKNIPPIKLIDYNVNTNQHADTEIQSGSKSRRNKMIKTDSETNREYENKNKSNERENVKHEETTKRNLETDVKTSTNETETHSNPEEKDLMEESTINNLFQIKAERIDEEAEGKLFYDSEKFKKPPEIVYPEEYPEEFIYINSPPLLIITSTVYTSIPDVMFVTTQTTNLGLSYDYLTEEYKGDKGQRKSSDSEKKNLKTENTQTTESRTQIESSIDNNNKDDSRTLEEKINFENATRLNPTSINETTDFDDNDIENVKIDHQINETKKTERYTLKDKTLYEFDSKHVQKVSSFKNAVMKIPRTKNKTITFAIHDQSANQTNSNPQFTNSEKKASRVQRNNARQMVMTELQEAEWVIPVKPQGFTQSKTQLTTENSDAEWIIPQEKVKSTQDQTRARNFPTAEGSDAEWIIQVKPRDKTDEMNRKTTTENSEAEWIIPRQNQGRQLIQEENTQDAEWITPQGKSNDAADIVNRGRTESRHIENSQEVEWITQHSQGRYIPMNYQNNRPKTREFGDEIDDRDHARAQDGKIQEKRKLSSRSKVTPTETGS